VRKLLQAGLTFLDRIQVQMATAREFSVLIRLKDEKEKEIFPYLNRIEKSLREQGVTTKRAEAEDIKRILAVYFEQNVTTEKFENFDGERWVILNDEWQKSIPFLLELWYTVFENTDDPAILYKDGGAGMDKKVQDELNMLKETLINAKVKIV
jgi:hypothetical protein